MAGLWNLFLVSFWLFLPALIANQCPGFVAKLATVLPVPLHRPVSHRWLGARKTWSAYYAGPIGGAVAIFLQSKIEAVNASIGMIDYGQPQILLVGFLFGLGAVLGDHAESFLKRRMGIPPGDAWWPFDQLDFVLGAIVLTAAMIPWTWQIVSMICLAMLVIHPFGNYIGMRLGLRETWW